jgi:predicted TIM-barrel fold metal-dependent hydrolase
VPARRQLKFRSMPDASKLPMDWRLPYQSWDTHVHVLEPMIYPYALSRTYTPEAATYYELLAFNANLTTTYMPQNIVLVQPSVYGNDNSLVIDSLKNHSDCADRSDRKLRAITVFNESTVTDEELAQWDELGVRGFRINSESTAGGIDYDTLNSRINNSATRVKAYENWMCQLYISGADWDRESKFTPSLIGSQIDVSSDIYDTVNELPISIIADHQGGMKGTTALPANVTSVTEQPGFQSLLALAKAGKVYIKISAFYRSSKLTSGGYDDMEPLIKKFAEEVPERLIWASDWPHTSGLNRTEANRYVSEPFRIIDDAAVLRNIRKWVSPDVWTKMMVETPGKIYK